MYTWFMHVTMEILPQQLTAIASDMGHQSKTE